MENLLAVKREHNLTENGEYKSVSFENEIADNDKSSKKESTFKNVFIFILGARLLVDYGTQIAIVLSIPQRTVSVGAIAIGTSLPELVTAVSALKKKSGALSIGNILGKYNRPFAYFADMLVCIIQKFRQSRRFSIIGEYGRSNMPCGNCNCGIPHPDMQKFSRWQGAVLLAGYAVYIAMLFVQS